MPMEFAESKKKRKPLPGYAILIIVLGSLSLIGGIAKGILTAQTEQAARQVQDLLQGDASSSTSTESFVGVTPLSFKGLSMKIPKGWTSETTDEAGGLVHQIYLESSDVDYSVISWGISSNLQSPKDWIQFFHDEGGKDFSEYSPGEITTVSYCGEDAYSFSFSYKQLGFTFYGKGFSFKKDGNTFMVMNMSDLRSNLSKRFSFIEETITIE